MGNGDERSSYTGSGQRVWKWQLAPGGGETEKVFFYGIGGQLIEEYDLTEELSGQIVLTLASKKLYFGGQLIRDGDNTICQAAQRRLRPCAAGITDRLGSVVWKSGNYVGCFPYGEARHHFSSCATEAADFVLRP